jgi:hypothetical protein
MPDIAAPSLPNLPGQPNHGEGHITSLDQLKPGMALEFVKVTGSGEERVSSVSVLAIGQHFETEDGSPRVRQLYGDDSLVVDDVDDVEHVIIATETVVPGSDDILPTALPLGYLGLGPYRPGHPEYRAGGEGWDPYNHLRVVESPDTSLWTLVSKGLVMGAAMRGSESASKSPEA